MFCRDEFAPEQVRKLRLGWVLERREQVVQIFRLVLRWSETVFHRALLVRNWIKV